MNLTATIDVSESVTNCHLLKIMFDDNLVTQVHLTLDDIESLELSLTDMILDISRYRRKLQREEI